MISIIIPTYNEEACLSQLFEELKNFTQDLKDPWELIFVDDHSEDDTPYLLKEFCKSSKNFKMIRLSRNSGSHIAIIAGLRYCQGDCATHLSADLQDPPELINQMLQEWRNGAHVVWAVRQKREGIGFFERFCSSIFHFLFNALSTVKQPPGGSDFALLDRRVIDAVLESARPNLNLNPLIISRGFEFVCVSYTKKKRVGGQSKWTFSKKIKNFIDAFSGYSYIPLRTMSIGGFFVSFAGLGYACYLMINYIFLGHRAVEGWSSLMVVIVVLGGTQMMMLGLLGEYLWRTFEAARNTPLFFIQESVGIDDCT